MAAVFFALDASTKTGGILTLHGLIAHVVAQVQGQY